MKKLLNKVTDFFGNPKYAKAIHGWFTVIWLLVSVPSALLFGDLVVFVTWLSLYAIVVAHWSSWQATRTEIRQEEADRKLQEDHERLKKLDPDHPREAVDEEPDEPEFGSSAR